MSWDRSPIPRLGLVETTVAKLYVLTGEWPAWYREMLDRSGVSRPPAHLVEEIKIMKRRHEAGDPEWRAGTSRRASSRMGRTGTGG